jgi:ligand-binding SRPBCC domain-containing protein
VVELVLDQAAREVGAVDEGRGRRQIRGRGLDPHLRAQPPARGVDHWDPPNEFVGEQLRGPYATWVHRHRFTDLADGGTLIEDDVRFRLPFGTLGALAGPLVRRQLRQIFRYRRNVISTIGDKLLR